MRAMGLIKGANLALRFLLELCVLGALGYWGFRAGNATIAAERRSYVHETRYPVPSQSLR